MKATRYTLALLVVAFLNLSVTAEARDGDGHRGRGERGHVEKRYQRQHARSEHRREQRRDYGRHRARHDPRHHYKTNSRYRRYGYGHGHYRSYRHGRYHGYGSRHSHRGAYRNGYGTAVTLWLDGIGFSYYDSGYRR